MNPVMLILALGLFGAFVIAILYVGPAANKFLSHIWSEEELPVVKRETKERLDELFIDGDVPEETAVLMTATEENMEEKELLEMFQAVDAKDLKSIVTSKGSKFSLIFGALDKIGKKNMRRR